MSDFERLLKDILENKASPETLFLVLPELSSIGRTGLVIRHCHKALEAHPDHNGLRIILAQAYMDSGLTARASDELERVTRNIDESVKSYALLAKAYETQGRRHEAARCLNVYLAHHPEDSNARESLERLRPQVEESNGESLGKPDSEEFDFVRDEALPEIATPTLAELYYSQGQINAAVETYEKYLSRSPHDSRAMIRLGELKSLIPSPPEDPPEEPLLTDAHEDAEKAPSTTPETIKSRKLISMLEDWLSRIRETRINASV